MQLKMAASSKTISVLAPHSMNISKIKLKKGQQVSKGTIVCLYSTETNVTQKFKSNDGGIVVEILAKEGEFTEKGSVLFTVQGCNHPTVMKDMCADCGADLRIENSTAGNRKEEVSASVAMVHSIPELIVSEELAKELGKADEERLIKTRKLVLLVDLDQTLIHTTNDNIPANLKDVHHYQLWHGNQLLWYHTRLRPQTETFLKNISQLYELHICTFGSRIYAHTIARILDPEGKYFSHRILSRDECFNAQSKTANLKALFPCGDAMVCIIDDREDVWHCSPNLVHVKPYRFFQGTADINAPPGLTKTEHDSETLVHRVRKVSQSSTGSKDENSENKTECETEKNESLSSKECIKKQSSENAESESAKSKFENKIVSSRESGKCAKSGKDEIEISEADEGFGKYSDLYAMETESIVENKNETNTSENNTEIGNENDMEETSCDEVTNTIYNSKDGENAGVDVKEEIVGENRKIEITENDEQSQITDTKENRKNVNTDETGSGDGKDFNSKNPVGEIDGKNKHIEGPERDSDDKVEGIKNPEETDGKFNISEEPVKETDDKVKCIKNSEETDCSVNISEEPVKETDDEVKGIKNPEETDENKKDENVEDEWIEWDDEDDYLFYLEEILKTIHSAFFDFYDQLKDKENVEKGEEKSEKPSLKTLIPYIKKKVLKGCNMLFSGVIPTNMTPEKSRAYIVAKSLGANIHTELKTKRNEKDPNNFTTHLVAAKHGTTKVRSAMKYKHIKKVSPDWLWSCAERWERVEEILFPIPTATDTDDQGRDSPDVTKLLGNKSVAKRKRQTENGNDVNEADTKRLKKVSQSNELEKEDSNDFSSEANDTSDADKKDGENDSGNEKKPDNFSMSYNPMLAFSDDDLAYMDKEVEDEMDDEDQSSEDDNSRDCRFRKEVLKSKDLNDSSSEDSLSGAMPRGWGLKHKISPKSSSEDEMKVSNSPGQEVGPEYESETDQDKFDKIMEAFGPETENSDEEYAESVGSVDEEIADAVVKEFLS